MTPSRRRSEWLLSWHVEPLALVACVFFLAMANRSFLAASVQGRSLAEPSTWGFALALAVGVVALQLLVVLLLASRKTIKPLLSVLIVTAVAASFYVETFGVYIDPSMMRNTLRTDWSEASELLTWRFALHMLVFAGLPLALLWRLQVRERGMAAFLGWRLAWLLAAGLALAVSLLAVFQPLSSLMRNHKEIRYLVTPANVLWSSGAVLAAQWRGAKRPRETIGLDAKAGPTWAAAQRPRVVVLVVGETARAANWGLNGYARQTTPRLASAGVINFSNVTACGTNTEVSVPCMFAPVGRRQYDEDRIRGQDSLLHIVARAGVNVHWRDNQSGCKGVCDGLPQETVSAQSSPELCTEGRCLDEALVADLDVRLTHLLKQTDATAPRLWVLHMLGNHGPSYFKRYPPAFARFQPECRSEDLRTCSVEEIRNAYDNGILYTDHVLATTIARLQARASEVDSALVYVSDHGESLGEKGLFLHGIPYAIAPREQTHVPMILWSSAGFEPAAGLRADCLKPTLTARAAEPLAHDHLFHTLLGLLDVQTSLREATLDLTAACRRPGP